MCDVFSFGVMLLELFFPGYYNLLRQPNGAKELGPSITSKLLSQFGDNTLLASLAGLTGKCLRRDPKQRPTFEEIQTKLEEMATKLMTQERNIRSLFEPQEPVLPSKKEVELTELGTFLVL